MENFKLLVDILSSIASFVAIATVLYALYASKKCPIEIPEVIVSKSDNDNFRFIVKIKNSKPYPVTIKSITCYRKITHRVEKRKMERPRIRSVFDLSDRIFTNRDEFIVSELGEQPLIIKTKIDHPPGKSLTFLTDSTHGFITIKCKHIKLFNTETEIFCPEFMVSKSSKTSTLPTYIRGHITHAIDLLPLRINWLRKLIAPKGIE